MPSKSFEDINPIIKKYVEQEAVLYHDGMKSYEQITEPFKKVKIEKGDADPQADKITCMDTLWGNVRYYMRKIQGGAVSVEELEVLLSEILLRIQSKREGIEFTDNLFQIIEIYYPLVN